MSEIEIRKDSIPAISHGPFTATPFGLEIERGQEIPYELWAEYGKGLRRVEGAIQWVIGDWLRFGEFKYGEKYAQATEVWPESEQKTLMNYQWCANSFPTLGDRSQRWELSWSHYYIAAAVEEPRRSQLLDEANEKESSVRELRQAIRAHQIGEIKESDISIPEGTFNVIVVDPPWPYGTQYDADGRRAASPYPEMSLLEIAANAPPAADDCILWLWTTHKFMRDAYTLLDLWEFRSVAIVTWVKDSIGLGDWLRSQSEFCIMAVKGKPQVALTNQATVIAGPLREHSRKPNEFYEMVDSLVPAQSRKLDMYSRERRREWEQIGNEPRKY